MSKLKYDLISIGDSTLDTFLKLDEASVICDFDKENCWLCMSYADKIPIARLDFATGGNSSNMAVGAARLGLSPAFYTIIGDDDSGKKVYASLKKEGVDIRYVHIEKGAATNYSAVLNYQTERTILVYHVPRKYQLPRLASAEWIYYSSMGKGFEVIHKDLINYIKTKDIALGFNPGTHQLKSGIEGIGDILELTDVFLVNRDEAKLILGRYNRPAPKELLRGLRHLGPTIVVITDGPNGAYAFDGKKYYYMPILEVKVVERTGAGDSFSTGFLSAIIYKKDVAEALRWGTFNSASVIQFIGPQAGLLTKKQMHQYLRRYPRVRAKEI